MDQRLKDSSRRITPSWSVKELLNTKSDIEAKLTKRNIGSGCPDYVSTLL